MDLLRKMGWLLTLCLLILLGGCAVHGDVDICPDVRNDDSNVLRRHHPPGS